MKLKYYIDMNNPIKGVQKFKQPRKAAIVRQLEANGYEVERSGRQWDVWHPSIQGVTCNYDSLSEMKAEGDNPLNV